MNVDGKPVAWTGGMNFAETYDTWHDGMIRLEGPAVGPLSSMYAQRWRGMGNQISETHKQLIQSAHSRGAVEGAKAGVAIISNTPKNGPEALQLTRHFFSEAANTKERFWFQNPLLTSPEMVNQIILAAKQTNPDTGKPNDVRLVVPGKDGALNSMTYAMQRSHYRPLLEAGVRIFELPQMTHFKLLLADDRPSVTSLNVADRSYRKDFELGAAVVGDKKFLGEVESLMLSDMARSKELSMSDVDSMGTRMLTGAQKLIGFKV
jgi:cardiolipin synthase